MHCIVAIQNIHIPLFVSLMGSKFVYDNNKPVIFQHVLQHGAQSNKNASLRANICKDGWLFVQTAVKGGK